MLQPHSKSISKERPGATAHPEVAMRGDAVLLVCLALPLLREFNTQDITTPIGEATQFTAESSREPLVATHHPSVTSSSGSSPTTYPEDTSHEARATYPDDTSHEARATYPDDTSHKARATYPDDTSHEARATYPDDTPHVARATYPDDTPHVTRATYPDDTPHVTRATYPDVTSHEARATYPDDTSHVARATYPDDTSREDHTTYPGEISNGSVMSNVRVDTLAVEPAAAGSGIQIMSHIRGNSTQTKMTNSSEAIQSVKSPLGSVDLVVPSLRGMELPVDMVLKNRSQQNRHARTDAPPMLLNYIFDTYSTLNKHSHRNDRFGGPRIVSSGGTVTVDTQSRAELDCKVVSLQDKLVSWVRSRPRDDTLEILTIGQQTFTADLRFSVTYLMPDTWRLVVEPTLPEDSGSYECQLSTHPPIISKHHLVVHPPSVQIVDGGKERYYERNSTLSLGCSVKHFPEAQVIWLHNHNNLNDDITRGGISVKTQSTGGGADSTLQVARLTHNDSGVYTCACVCVVRPPLLDAVIVHVLNESLAELHQGGSSGKATTARRSIPALGLVVMATQIILNAIYHDR